MLENHYMAFTVNYINGKSCAELMHVHAFLKFIMYNVYF
jgi:hypothetical protein